MNKSEIATRMPQCKAFIDDMRAHFGMEQGGRASEGGISIEWKKPPPLNGYVVPIVFNLATQKRNRK